MTRVVRAVVVGAGWAGEGYTHALRRAGAEVVALCGRTPEPARAMARKLGVADVRLDWRTAVEELRPEVVVVATPAPPHHDIVQAAAALGCHVLCDKPLGRDAGEARAMLEAVVAAGLTHAYGATSSYAPALRQARRMVVDGVIGEPREVEAVVHFGVPRLLSHFWMHDLAAGGGLLMNVLPHFLGQVQHLLDGAPVWAVGHADPGIDRAPVGPALHDFRDWSPVDPAAAATGEWRPVDADLRATVVVGLATPAAGVVRASWHASAFGVGRHPGHLTVTGTEGALHLTGQPWSEKLEHQRPGSPDWSEIPLEQSDYLPDPVQYGWDRLTEDFLAEIRGGAGAGHPTFRDGLVANQIIDRVRAMSAAPADLAPWTWEAG